MSHGCQPDLFLAEVVDNTGFQNIKKGDQVYLGSNNYPKKKPLRKDMKYFAVYSKPKYGLCALASAKHFRILEEIYLDEAKEQSQSNAEEFGEMEQLALF